MNLALDENFFRIFFDISLWSVLKIFVCFAFLLYIIFAAVVVKQVFLMIQTVGGQLEIPLKVIAAAHLAGAIFIFVLAVIIL